MNTISIYTNIEMKYVVIIPSSLVESYEIYFTIIVTQFDKFAAKMSDAERMIR